MAFRLYFEPRTDSELIGALPDGTPVTATADGAGPMALVGEGDEALILWDALDS